MLASPPDSETGSVRSVERALDLLAALEKAGRPVSLSALARAAGMPVTTALRLLSVLERRGLVEKERGAYQLAAAIVSLSTAFLTGNSLTRASLPVLEQLAVTSGETASVYVRQGFERVIVQRVNSPHPLHYSVRVGERRPLLLGSGGQVLASAMPEEELRRHLETVGEIRLATGQLLTTDDMLARLEQVRRQGFAVSLEERVIGVASVAAPIIRPDRPITAAVGVTGPPSRMAENIGPLSLEVRRAAAEIAAAWDHA